MNDGFVLFAFAVVWVCAYLVGAFNQAERNQWASLPLFGLAALIAGWAVFG